MKIGDVVRIEGRRPEDGIIKRFSFINGLVQVNLVNGGWMMVDERDIKEK